MDALFFEAVISVIEVVPAECISFPYVDKVVIIHYNKICYSNKSGLSNFQVNTKSK